MSCQNSSGSSEELRRIFSCKICFEPFSRNVRYPVSLRCGHSFCIVCVKKLAESDQTFIQCGICRRLHLADYGQLNKNIVLTDMLEHFNLLINDSTAGNAKDGDGADGSGSQEVKDAAGRFVTPDLLTDLCAQLKLLENVVGRLPASVETRPEHIKQLSHLRDNARTIEKELHSTTNKFFELNRTLSRLCGEVYQSAADSFQPGQGADPGIIPAEFDDFTVPPVFATPSPPATPNFNGTSRPRFIFDNNEWPSVEEVLSSADSSFRMPQFNGTEWGFITPSSTDWTDFAGNWNDFDLLDGLYDNDLDFQGWPEIQPITENNSNTIMTMERQNNDGQSRRCLSDTRIPLQIRPSTSSSVQLPPQSSEQQSQSGSGRAPTNNNSRRTNSSRGQPSNSSNNNLRGNAMIRQNKGAVTVTMKGKNKITF